MWIEIVGLEKVQLSDWVTSLAEVWIEILAESVVLELGTLSLPLRKCGLKLYDVAHKKRAITSLPLRKCGLKSSEPSLMISISPSLPLRKCGLK